VDARGRARAQAGASPSSVAGGPWRREAVPKTRICSFVSPVRARGRRIAEAVLGVGKRARARRAVGSVASAPASEQPATVSAEEAATRLDAARERLRSKIPAPADDESTS